MRANNAIANIFMQTLRDMNELIMAKRNAKKMSLPPQHTFCNEWNKIPIIQMKLKF